MEKFPYIILAIFFSLQNLFAEDVLQRLDQAAVFFNTGNFEKSMEICDDLLASDFSLSEQQRQKAWYIYGKAALSNGYLSKAREAWSFLLDQFNTTYRSEVLYLFGKTLYLQQEYAEAVSVFNHYLIEFPDSHLKSHALYWAGESSFYLGELDTAYRYYEQLLSEYPTSEKMEAAYYRCLLIDSLLRENHLLEVLRRSHTQNLTLQKDIQAKEQQLESLIRYYQNILNKEQQNHTDFNQLELLEIKKQTLELKEFYLNELFEVLYE